MTSARSHEFESGLRHARRRTLLRRPFARVTARAPPAHAHDRARKRVALPPVCPCASAVKIGHSVSAWVAVCDNAIRQCLPSEVRAPQWFEIVAFFPTNLSAYNIWLKWNLTITGGKSRFYKGDLVRKREEEAGATI
jgi:hypothetical protein